MSIAAAECSPQLQSQTTHIADTTVIAELTKNNTVRYHGDRLSAILLNPEWKGMKIAVYTIVGLKRCGKTTVLDQMDRFLGQRFETSEMPLHFVPPPVPGRFSRWDGQSRSMPATSSLAITSRPFFVDSYRNVAIFLLDCPGIGLSSPMDSRMRLAAFAAAISSQLIFNTMTHDFWKVHNMLRLMATIVVHIKGAAAIEDVFQNMLLLVRDWDFPEELPFGPVDGHKWLQKHLEQDKRFKDDLKALFGTCKIGCFLMPSPGEAMLEARNLKEGHAQCSDHFLAELHRLYCCLFANPVPFVGDADISLCCEQFCALSMDLLGKMVELEASLDSMNGADNNGNLPGIEQWEHLQLTAKAEGQEECLVKMLNKWLIENKKEVYIATGLTLVVFSLLTNTLIPLGGIPFLIGGTELLTACRNRDEPICLIAAAMAKYNAFANGQHRNAQEIGQSNNANAMENNGGSLTSSAADLLEQRAEEANDKPQQLDYGATLNFENVEEAVEEKY